MTDKKIKRKSRMIPSTILIIICSYSLGILYNKSMVFHKLAYFTAGFFAGMMLVIILTARKIKRLNQRLSER